MQSCTNAAGKVARASRTSASLVRYWIAMESAGPPSVTRLAPRDTFPREGEG